MCKLLAILDIENEDNAIQFSDLAVKPMTAKDDDGLGIIILGDQGMGVERWLKPANFPEAMPIPAQLSKYASLLPNGYNYEGETSQTGIYAIGVHSRMATGTKCLENVHPFIRENLALIHNGVISNHNQFEKKVSSCDSEALLSLYLTHKVSLDLNEIQKVCDEATGWYAFMVFDPSNQTVTIAKDDHTSLHFAYVKGVGTVFCTTEEILKAVCGKMKLPQPEIFKFPENTVIRWTKDASEIQTIDIISQWYGKQEQKSIIDISHEFCEHNAKKGTWCRECYNVMGADYPEYLASHRHS